MRASHNQTQKVRSRLLWISCGAALLVFIGISAVSRPLNTPVAPSGIVAFELAGTPERAQQILSSWNPNAQLHAAFSLGFDYLFMISYAAAVILGCLAAGQVLQEEGWPFHKQSKLFAAGVLAAAGFDAVENLALWMVLIGNVVSPWPEIARACALVKFFLLFIGLVYAFYGLIISLLGKLKPEAS